MSALETMGRTWRTNRKRGVSPIIATILLVAITVVLAAVLYILVTGLVHTSSSAPFNVGMTSATPSTQATNNYWEVIPLSPTTGLTTAMFGLTVHNVNGVGVGTDASKQATNCASTKALSAADCTAPPATGDWYIVLASSANNTIMGFYNNTGWTSSYGTVAVTSSMELVLVSYVSYAGVGDSLVASSSGSSSISGSVSL